MHGHQLTFYTQQDRSHRGHPLGNWLVEAARNLGIGGATVVAAAEGFGRDRKIHAARFFELASQPIEVTMAVTAAESEQLFTLLRQEGINVFYVKTPIEFGMSGDTSY